MNKLFQFFQRNLEELFVPINFVQPLFIQSLMEFCFQSNSIF